MKPKYLIYGILALVIIGLLFISGCVQNYCVSLEKELKTRFNELSKSCSVDDDCAHITVSTGCLAPCPTCVHNSENINLIEQLEKRLRELKCPVQMCAPKCAITTCKCINGTCQGIIPSTTKPPEITCGWCGRTCVKYPISEEDCKAANGIFLKQCACPEVTPPEDFICVEANGKCLQELKQESKTKEPTK